MRVFALAVLTVAGFAAVPGVASAADIPVTEACEAGLVWNGYDCVEAPTQQAQQGYSAPQEYDPDPGYEPAPVYEVPRVYAAPPVYVARPYYAPRPYYGRPVYVAPVYPRRVVRYYPGPRYGWGPRPIPQPWHRRTW